MTVATLTLAPDQSFLTQHKESGETVLIVPLDAVKQAYCDYVANEVGRRNRAAAIRNPAFAG